MQTLYDLGWRGSVFIVDDNFIGNQRNVKRFLRELIPWVKQHNYPNTFITEASMMNFIPTRPIAEIAKELD